jgi:hypothetical protein
MIYEIDSELLTRLTLDERHVFAKILAYHSAFVADKQQREIQDKLRRKLLEVSPAVAATRAYVAERAKQDVETVYVPASRGVRRTIILNPTPSPIPAPPVPPPPPLTWFEKLWAWLTSFPFPKESDV